MASISGRWEMVEECGFGEKRKRFGLDSVTVVIVTDCSRLLSRKAEFSEVSEVSVRTIEPVSLISGMDMLTFTALCGAHRLGHHSVQM